VQSSAGPSPDRGPGDGPAGGRLAACVGVALKPQHCRTILATRPQLGFLEVHAENYMGAGGPPHRALESICAEYPLSIHGVCLSIGSSDGLDREHLQRLRRVVERYEPALVSEHLAWSTHDRYFLNDLLPLPYTRSTLALVCAHVDEVQTALRRPILLENPSAYLRFDHDEFAETGFLAEVAARTGCRLLLDVNNVMVSATNLGMSARACIDAFPVEYVDEIHLAGFHEDRDGGQRMLIDDHGSAVHPDVWSLYRYALGRTGPVPTLIEWDNEVPEWGVLLDQSRRADTVLRERSRPSPPRVTHHADRLA
jgi:uncharacterized protein (UPF0276 family)